MRLTDTLLALAVPLAAIPGMALACSVVEDYRVPTNLELAADANAIVVGEVVGATEAATAPDEALSSAIEVRPVAAIKGLLPGGSLIIPGMAVAPASGAAGEPLDFGQPHPDALAGSCIRRTFPAGATVLFFLKRADGGWAPAGDAFSRWAEDVSGPGDPWVQLATLYAHAAQLQPAERAALLGDQLEALQARIDAEADDDPVTLAMATDIERAMAGPGFPQFAARAPEPAPAAPVREDAGELGARIDALAEER